MSRTEDTPTAHAEGRARLRLRRGLYVVGGGAALIAALLFRRNLGAEFVLLRALGVIGFGPTAVPTSAGEWFALLGANRLIGLTLFNVFDLVNYALLGVIFLALYVALRRADRRLVAIAVVLGLGGVIVAFASSRAFPMLSLSRQYAAASEGERAVLLGEGERLLAVDNPGALYPGAGPTMALFLVTLAAVIVAIVMLRSPVFSRGTATVGLVGESVQLLYFVALALAPLPVLLAISSSLAAPFRLVWYLLIGRRLLQLARATKRDGETALT